MAPRWTSADRAYVEYLHSLGKTRATVYKLTGIPKRTLSLWAAEMGFKWKGSGRPKGGPCDRCEHRSECSQYKLHPKCEREIEVLGQPESKLWANHGGREAWEQVYGGPTKP